jgi:hypothetical protein
MVRVTTQQKWAIQVNYVISAQFTRFSSFGALMFKIRLCIHIKDVEKFVSSPTVMHPP